MKEIYIIGSLVILLFVIPSSSFNFSLGELTIVNGGSGIQYLNFSTKITNTGDLPLTCSIINAQPSILFNSFDHSLELVPISSSYTWNSGLIEMSQFEELPQPVRFSATIRCSYKKGINTVTLEDQTDFKNVEILTQCGDGICQEFEDLNNCLIDCGHVNYRTSDLSYTTHSAIAFTSSCGASLTTYGMSSNTCWPTTSSTCPIVSGYSLVISSIPEGVNWADDPGCLYTKDGDPSQIAVSFKTKRSGGPCSVVNRWGAYIFDSDDSDSSNVAISNIPIDSSKEIIC